MVKDAVDSKMEALSHQSSSRYILLPASIPKFKVAGDCGCFVADFKEMMRLQNPNGRPWWSLLWNFPPSLPTKSSNPRSQIFRKTNYSPEKSQYPSLLHHLKRNLGQLTCGIHITGFQNNGPDYATFRKIIHWNSFKFWPKCFFTLICCSKDQVTLE